MDAKIFDDLITKQLATIRDILTVKQQEYATHDRLHNFRIAAQIQGCSMEEALAGMLCKHTVSIYDMIRELGEDVHYPMPIWNEKINDHIIYLLLLRAILEERRANESVMRGVMANENIDANEAFRES